MTVWPFVKKFYSLAGGFQRWRPKGRGKRGQRKKRVSVDEGEAAIVRWIFALCYAFMQATGMVNDHLVTCFRHRELQ